MVKLEEYWAIEKALHDFHKTCRSEGLYYLRAHIKQRGTGLVLAVYHVYDFFEKRDLQFIKEFAEKRGMVAEYHESDPNIPWKPSIDVYFPKGRDKHE